MCPKCNGPTVERALFTSLYQHCERCEMPKRETPRREIGKINEWDEPPFVTGDTVYYLNGPLKGASRIVKDVKVMKIRRKGEKEAKDTWMVRFENSFRLARMLALH